VNVGRGLNHADASNPQHHWALTRMIGAGQGLKYRVNGTSSRDFRASIRSEMRRFLMSHQRLNGQDQGAAFTLLPRTKLNLVWEATTSKEDRSRLFRTSIYCVLRSVWLGPFFEYGIPKFNSRLCQSYEGVLDAKSSLSALI
jgi:hypothetical protein